MPSAVDVVVVGAGPAGSVAALVLARGGARVVLVDKAAFPRDKACGDVIGPRALAMLAALGLQPPAGPRLGDIVVVGPTGRRVVLPARAGLTYPDHGLAITRLVFDAWLHEAAVAAGAEPVMGRVASVCGQTVHLADGRAFTSDVVIGADGASSTVAATVGLVDPTAVLWGFAQRTYVQQRVAAPIIALWDDPPGVGFPGYGWLFPSVGGVGNVGLGIGVRAQRSEASRAVARLDAFSEHLHKVGCLDAPVEGRRLGGWLKMGMVGTIAARGRVLLVGDAAGLVNPLQGEGIAAAMTSAAAAAEAVLASPSSAAARYRRHLAVAPGRFAAVAAPVHAAMVGGSSRRTALVGRALTMPGLRQAIAPTWSLTWSDLLDGAPPSFTTASSKLVMGVGRLLTRGTSVRRQLNGVVGDDDDEA